MRYYDALKALARERHMTLTAIAEATGRERTYISSCVSHGATPSVTVANELAAPLGYGLALVPLDAIPDSALPIDDTHSNA